MIRNIRDEKVTPKQMAQEVLMDHVSTCLGYWQERLEGRGMIENMTEREVQLVDEQLQKLANRVAKICGYTEAWSS